MWGVIRLRTENKLFSNIYIMKKMCKKKNWKLWKMLAGIAGGIAMFAAAVALVMVMWNWLMPDVAGFAEIDFWKAAGMLVLCRLLTGRLFPHHGRHGHRGRHRGGKHWHEMSPEMKREFMRRYWNAAGDSGFNNGPDGNVSSGDDGAKGDTDGNDVPGKCRYGYGEMGYEQ